MDRYALAGLVTMIVSEAATLARIEPFWSWNTPICWTGFIVFADSVVWQARGTSWMRSNGREFVWLALASIPLWLVFEGYNQIIRNWYYTGLPMNRALRLAGYAWSFATIWPAIFEGAELVAVVRSARAEPERSAALGAGPAPARPVLVVSCVGAGVLMLAAPFVLPRAVAPYLAAPVWLGFIVLLDPINARLGAESLLADVRVKRYDRTVNLLASGLLCGILWEFWNFWAGAKWHYTVPFLSRIKVFEMPLPGYLGFPPFALECFTMYVFVRTLVLPLLPAAAYESARTPDAASALARSSSDQIGRPIGL